MSSSDSSDSDDSLPPEFLNIAAAEAADHFQFDPVASSDSERGDDGIDVGGGGGDGDDDDPERWRLGNVIWCTCGHCRPMSKPLESKRCREIARVDARVPAGETCITAHPTFTQGVLNIHALEIAYCWFMEDRPGMVDEPEIHSAYRHVAYRQFVRWIWRVLGRNRRVVIPSCAVSKIREAFPSEEYTGFQYPRV